MLGAQPSRALRRHPVGGLAHRLFLLALVASLPGCVSRMQLAQQDRELRTLIKEDRARIQQLQRELERMRADLEGGSRRSGPSGEDRVGELERRIAELEGPRAPKPDEEPPPAAPPDDETVARQTPPTTMPPPPPVDTDPWRQEVGREQAAAVSSNAPERTEYASLLDPVAKKDCSKASTGLTAFANTKKDSPLADNALYWAARCFAVRGDSNQAIARFYDVVTRYPKGDKTPAALLAQGSLFLQIGDTPDARLSFSKLIRDYPGSEEAARARQKLAEIER